MIAVVVILTGRPDTPALRRQLLDAHDRALNDAGIRRQRGRPTLNR